MKKSIYILYIFLWFIISNCASDRNVFLPIDAIPFSSSMIIETERIDRVYNVLHKSKFNKVLRQISTAKQIQKNYESILKFLDTYKINRNRKFVIASIDVGPDEFDFLWVTPTHKLSQVQLLSFLKKIASISHSKYDGIRITKVGFKSRSVPNLYIIFYKEVIVFSTQKILVEDAIRHIHSSIKLSDSKEFKRAYKLRDKDALVNVFINYKYVGSLCKKLLPKFRINHIDRFANWTIMDIDISSDTFKFSGVTIANDSVPHYLNLYRDTPEKQIVLDKVLPYNMASAVVLNIGELFKYQKKQKQYLDVLGRYNPFKRNIHKYSFDMNQIFLPWVADEIAVFYNSPQPNPIDNTFAIVLAKDAKIADENLQTIRQEELLYAHRGYNIYRVKYKNILYHAFGNIFRGLKQPYYTILGDIVIFSNNLGQMKSYINDFLEDRTLYTKNDYLQLKDELVSETGLLLIGKNPSFVDWLYSVVDRSNYRTIRNIKTEFSNIKFGLVQIAVEDDNIFFTNGIVIYNENKDLEVKQLWSLQLKHPIKKIVSLPINHYTKKREVLVQDKNNIIHLISDKGKVLWSKEIEDTIIGKAHQVDLYKNTKLQMVFNTAEYIYIIDRNGKTLRRIRLPKSTDLPISVFDYDNIKNYRFLATVGKLFYMYDKRGKIVEGFKFKSARNKIKYSPKHYKIYNRDYIVFQDVKGYIYIINRRGNHRLKINKRWNISQNKIYYSTPLKSWVTTTSSGELLQINLSGKSFKSAFENLERGHYFECIDGGMLTVNKSELTFKNKYSNFSFSFDLPKGVHQIKTIKHKFHKFYTFVNKQTEKVYILDDQGELVNNFPVYGSVIPMIEDIDKDSKYNVLTITKDGTILNYAME